MKFKPDAVMRAIRIAQAIGSKIDPSFATIPMPKAGEGVPLERSSGGTARDVRMPMHYPARMADGGTPSDFKVNNAMSVFPKPQRMWDDQRPGGAYLSMPDQQDITGHKAAQASIGIGDGGKPYFHASRDEVDETGTPGKGSALVKTNLFKQKAGWKWKNVPEGHENTSTIVSVEYRGNHHYVLGAHFPNGVDLSRYPDATSEPRLRPTTRGNVELGPQVGSILVRGREHPVHSHAIVREYGGRVGYADGGSDDDSRDLNEFGLYSHAAEQALGLQRTDTPENYKQMLLKRNVKPAEFDWSGYDKAFADQPQVTREQVSSHFENNMPEVFETQYGIEPMTSERQEMLERHNGEYFKYISNKSKQNENGVVSSNDPEYKEMIERHNKEKREFGPKTYSGEPYHDSYTIPGGENYREVLARHGNENYNFPGVGSHFGGDENIIASLRLKDRKDTEGDNVLHLEELQSDWGQNARKHGIKDDDRIFNARMRYLKSKDATREAQESEDAYKIMEAEKERREAVEEFNSAINGVENAPYIGKTDDWVDFGLKRALFEAAKGNADGDYHKLAWSPGDVQANRYDLSKHIGEIRHSANENGTYDIEVYSPNGKFLTAKNDMEGHELPNLVGKELSDKIFSGEGESVDNGKNHSHGDWRSLSGLDLKVGGEGMRKFYDQMLPKRLLKLARMHDPDARLVSSEVEHPATYDYRAKSTQLPALEITPKMRASILKKGFPAYADGGEVDGYDDGGSVGGHPLTNPVYHGVKSDSVSSPLPSGLGMEMFDANHPSLNYIAPNVTALALGPHVARDPNISGDMRFTTGEQFLQNDAGDFNRHPLRAQGHVALINTFPDEKFFPVEQSFDDFTEEPKSSASRDDQAVHNTVYADVFQNNPKLTRKVLKAMGKAPEHIESYVRGFQSGEPFEDPISANGFKWPDVKSFVNSSNIPAGKNLTGEVVKDFRKRMRDRGYVGLSYINTDSDETANAQDKKCYIVFPQRDKETGWYPMRFRHGAAYDPANKGKPGLHLSTGGEADGYELGGTPENPMMSAAGTENVPSVTVSPRPGKMGGYPVREGKMFDPETGNDVEPWHYAGPQGEDQPMPPPVQHPAFNEPRMDKIHKATHKIFKSKGFNDLTEELTGLRNFNVTPIMGTWKGEMEPSFVVHHPDMTPEAAEKLSHLLGFGFMQDASVQGAHNPNPDGEGIPSLYMGRDKKLSRADLNRIAKASKEEGLDFSQTSDGKGVKFMHFGDDGDEYDKFTESAKRIADRAKLPYMHHVNTTGSLNYAQDYLKGIFGSDEGEGGESGLHGGSSRPSDLFGRVVTHLVAPYAKAVASEGYRLSPERLKDTYGLTDDEHEQVRKALMPGSGDRTVIPLMEGKENLDIRPTGDRGKATVGDALFALQNRAAAKGQIEPGDYSPEAMKKIAGDIAKEVNYHVNTADKSAIGWYDAALKKAMNAYEDVFPELKTDADKRTLFHAILGITSQGNDVHSNSVHTARLYNYLRDGSMTLPEGVQKLSGTFGDKTNAIEQNLLKFHQLVDTNGYDKMRDLFGQKKSVSEWNKILKKTPELYGPNGKPLSMKGGATQKVTGWTMFGPKIGSFINNLSGDYSTLTADLWFSRTWNRLLGHNFLHTPIGEAKQYQDFRDAMIAEHAHNNPDQALDGVAPGKTSSGKVAMVNGAPKPWEHGNDVGHMSHDEMDSLVNDPDKMLEMAQTLNDKYRKGGYKQKTDLRRRAKNWIENRENPVAMPRTDNERDFQQNTAEKAQKILKSKYGKDISVADIQAALWFLEKDLFGKMGVASEKAAPADYADAAKNTIDLIKNKQLYRVKSRDAEQLPVPKANGGAINKAILVAMRAKKRSPIAIK